MGPPSDRLIAGAGERLGAICCPCHPEPLDNWRLPCPLKNRFFICWTPVPTSTVRFTPSGGLTTSAGVPTNAVFGFVQMLLKVLKDAKPSHLAVVYDTKGPTFRHKLYPAYKANRPPLDPALKSQFPLVRQVVTALNLPAVEAEGFEADDLMATLAKKAEEQGYEVVLVSGDKDLFQLLNGNVTMWDTMKELRLGPDEVKEKLGVGPERIVDLQALWGDSTDNVPGVPGVGKVTAARLINQHGGLEDILAAVGGMKKSKMKENLLANFDKARLSAKLVELSTEAPVEFMPEAFEVHEPDPKVLTPVLAQLEFNRLIKEFAQAGPPPKGDYRLVTSQDELDTYLQKAFELGRVAVDTETTSVDSMEAELVGFSLSHESGSGIYVPVGHNLPPEKTGRPPKGPGLSRQNAGRRECRENRPELKIRPGGAGPGRT